MNEVVRTPQSAKHPKKKSAKATDFFCSLVLFFSPPASHFRADEASSVLQPFMVKIIPPFQDSRLTQSRVSDTIGFLSVWVALSPLQNNIPL